MMHLYGLLYCPLPALLHGVDRGPTVFVLMGTLRHLEPVEALCTPCVPCVALPLIARVRTGGRINPVPVRAVFHCLAAWARLKLIL